MSRNQRTVIDDIAERLRLSHDERMRRSSVLGFYYGEVG